MFKRIARKTSSLVASDTKMITLAAIIVSMACLVPISVPHQKAYSQSLLEQFPQYFQVPVPESDGAGLFELFVPDDWTKEQLYPYIDSVETVSASTFCPPAGCEVASVDLFAYLSTPGSFFPPGGTAQPEEVFRGLIEYSQGLGVTFTKTRMLPSEDSTSRLYAAYYYTDDQGQKIRGAAYYVLSEELGVLWDISYDAREDSWAEYEPIFLEIQGTVKPLFPTDPYVICHENPTSQCLAMVSAMIRDNTNIMIEIAKNMAPGCTITEHLERKC